MKKIIELNVDDLEIINSKITVSGSSTNENSLISSITCTRNIEDVQVLEARRLKINKIDKNLFKNLLSLNFIDLRENKILRIPKSFTFLKNLKVVHLDNNKLNYLPVEISKLENLEVLTLTNNQLSQLPSSITELSKLKILKISMNKIAKLSFELGHLKSLETLHIDSNFFLEIPNSIYFLKHLNDFSLEWLEFLDQPLTKHVSGLIGETIINFIKNSLGQLLKSNELYCSFNKFVEINNSVLRPHHDREAINRNLNSKNQLILQKNKNLGELTSQIVNTIHSIDDEYDPRFITQKKNLAYFFALENNYIGLIMSLIKTNSDYINIKNNENKTLLYMAIHYKQNELVKFILDYYGNQISQLPKLYLYLHKSIKLRDPFLSSVFLKYSSPNEFDSEGNNSFHILFSIFTKKLNLCASIGDLLLNSKYDPNALNQINKSGLSPLHIAIKKSTTDCLKWILNQNKILKSQNREIFDVNSKGVNDLSPLHLAVSNNKIEEALLLLENGADIFAKNKENKTPIKYYNGNSFLLKILKNAENHSMEKKYKIKLSHQININNFTTIEENSHFDDLRSFKKLRELNFTKQSNYSGNNSPYNLYKNPINDEVIIETDEHLDSLQSQQKKSNYKNTEKYWKYKYHELGINNNQVNSVKYENPQIRTSKRKSLQEKSILLNNSSLLKDVEITKKIAKSNKIKSHYSSISPDDNRENTKVYSNNLDRTKEKHSDSYNLKQDIIKRFTNEISRRKSNSQKRSVILNLKSDLSENLLVDEFDQLDFDRQSQIKRTINLKTILDKKSDFQNFNILNKIESDSYNETSRSNALNGKIGEFDENSKNI